MTVLVKILSNGRGRSIFIYATCSILGKRTGYELGSTLQAGARVRLGIVVSALCNALSYPVLPFSCTCPAHCRVCTGDAIIYLIHPPFEELPRNREYVVLTKNISAEQVIPELALAGYLTC